MIGSFVSICPAAKYDLLYTKGHYLYLPYTTFERKKFLALRESDNNFKAKLFISSELGEDFNWWLNVRSGSSKYYSNGSFRMWDLLRYLSHRLECFPLRSNPSVRSMADGLPRKGLHINALELKAAFYGLKYFAFDLSNCEILLRIDNTTAIFYINRFGSVKYPLLSLLSKAIWRKARNIWLVASYIAFTKNVADKESRRMDADTEWSLSKDAFRLIDRKFGPFDIDLFANINTKCNIFVSWIPDPKSFAVDAFTLDWGILLLCVFPFHLTPPSSAKNY